MAKKKQSKVRAAKSKKGNPIVQYLKETRAELRKVTWPTRDETVNLTVVVLVVTLGMAAFLGVLDYVFSKLVALLV